MSDPTSLVTGVDFVVVPTRDFDRAVELYGIVLGLPCSARYGRMPGAELETGSLTLAVMATEEFGMGFNPNRNPIALRRSRRGCAEVATQHPAPNRYW